MILQQISRGKEILQGNLPKKNSCTEKKKRVSLCSANTKNNERRETKLLVLARARQIIVAKNRTTASVKRCTLYVKRNVSFGQEAQWIPECSSVDRSFRYVFHKPYRSSFCSFKAVYVFTEKSPVQLLIFYK